MDTVLTASFIASLIAIVSSIKGLIKSLRKKQQDRDLIWRQVVKLRDLVHEMNQCAFELCSDIQRRRGSLTSDVLNVREVKKAIRDCETQLNKISDDPAVDNKIVDLCNATLRNLRDAFRQVKTEIRRGNVAMIFKAIGVIGTILDRTMARLEEEYTPRPSGFEWDFINARRSRRTSVNRIYGGNSISPTPLAPPLVGSSGQLNKNKTGSAKEAEKKNVAVAKAGGGH
jgi:hypothetical protein